MSKRRADEFDALLSTPAGARDDVATEEYAELLELVGSLRSMPEVEARPEFVSDLRSRLVVAAARQPVRVVDDATAARLTPRQRKGARERRLATALGGFAVVAASGSMAMASQSALPGDVLYPVKRAIENAQTNLESDDTGRAETLLAHAEQRLREVEALSARGDDDNADEIANTLQDFSEQANQATELVLDDYTDTGDTESVDRLRDFAGSSMGDLEGLGDQIPADARPALITAAQTVQQADNAAFQICPTCGDGLITELPEFTAGTASLPRTILGVDTTAETVAGDRSLAEEAEKKAGETPLRPQDPETETVDEGTESETDPVAEEPPATTPEPDVEPDTDDPLNQIGDEIKKQVGVKTPEEDPTQAAGEVTDGLVSGIGGLVDGLLLN